jgi:CubicO group peptidase (beta-lactamase class C family)
MSLGCTCVWITAATQTQCVGALPSSYLQPTFTDPQRLPRIRAVLPEIDQWFSTFSESEHLPGLVYGVVVDGELIHHSELGLANLERKIKCGPDTGFRIASMSKSFVCLAVFRLRDDRKLSLDDAVEKYLPELRKVQLPTADSPRITIRNLMTMTTGLPEDNPWGDRQLEISQEALRKFVRGGLSFSNPPGQEYEYSNLGYVLLGQVITKASGMSFQKYINTRLLRPLGMTNTSWEFADVPQETLAQGYRWEHNAWIPEPILHDGEGAACGGLITTLNDFAKYMRFHLDAWPARDGVDPGPIKRSTVREMQKPFVVSRMGAQDTLLDGVTPNPSVGFYGNGLGWSIDSRKIISLAHTGGLPGYGSHFRFLPDYGVGVYAFANRTYAPAARACVKAMNLLIERADLKPRAVIASDVLQTRATQIVEMITHWDPKLEAQIVAENFFLDQSRADRMAVSRDVLSKAGKILSIQPIVPENQLRGTFRMIGEHGHISVHFTLTPEKDPTVQQLDLTFVPKP